MTGGRPRPTERGSVAWIILALIALAGGYAFYRQARGDLAGPRRAAAQLATMAAAREALIARAVTDDNRPGSLPCPDLATDSNGLNNHPGDGKADMFTLTQCPSYVGWLPWVTLDLPEPRDDSDSRLWYALSPNLRDDDSAQPINSASAGALQLDGQDDIAALIIAPRAALGGQTRPSRRPADHLEGGNGNDLRYVTSPADSGFNDLILPLYRRDLMAAVERRVAGELRACLEQHAAAPGNPAHRYPWPAWLGDPDFRGRAASRFGRVPLTQPSAGPQAELQNATQALARSLAGLDRATEPVQRIAALSALGEQLAATRNLADLVFAIAERMKAAADAALAASRGIDSAVAAAVANDRISRSEGSLIRERDTTLAGTLEQLASQLAQSGLDAFPPRLAQLAAALTAANTVADRNAALASSAAVLAAAASPRTDVNLALAAARGAVVTALSAPAADATMAAEDLSAKLTALARTITATHANRMASDIEAQIAGLAGQLAAMPPLPDNATFEALRTDLRIVQDSIGSLVCGIDTVVDAQTAASGALAAALTADGTAPTLAAAASAIEALHRLAQALATNEAADGNLARTSLSTAVSRFKSDADAFSTVDLANPRPVQRDIAPYADAVGMAAVNVQTIAEMLSANTAFLAPLAVAPVGSDPARNGSSPGSLRAIAEQAQASLGGRDGSLTLQRALLTNPGGSDRATVALAETRRLTAALIVAADALAAPLSSAGGSALPMLWLSQRCDFLRPGANTWWSANRWADSLFFQLSSPSAASPGGISINGHGGYRLVTIAAGHELAGQRRTGPTPGIADFLESINADASRNPPAESPSGRFGSTPLGPEFNDQLSY